MTYQEFFYNINYLVGGCDRQAIEEIEDAIYSTAKDKSRVFLFGNGGSHTICEHISTDFNKRCGINALTLSNNSLLTCYANDYGYENVWSQFMSDSKIRSSDVVIFVSSSGKSPNIMNGLMFCANSKIDNTVLICGFDGHSEDSITTHRIKHYMYFPSKNYGEVELASEMVLHAIVESLVEKKNG